MKDSPNLDLLRSLAVSFVVVDHLRRPALHRGGELGQFTDALGLLGVAIFFVHTTLVLMQSLERAGGAALPFYVRRMFRIYPLSMLAACLGAYVTSAGYGTFHVRTLVSNLLLVQNIAREPSIPGPLWTLPYEVQMYLVLPLLFVGTRLRRPIRWLAPLWLAVGTVVIALWATNLPYRSLQFVPCFLPGIAAYVLAKRAPRFSPYLLFLVVATAVTVLPIVNAVHLPLTAFMWGFCAVLGFTIPQCREVTGPLFAGTGKIVATHSYGIYVTHTLIIGIAFNGFGFAPWPVRIAMFAVLMAVVPHAAYRFIEVPAIELGKRLATSLRRLGADAVEPKLASRLPGSLAVMVGQDGAADLGRRCRPQTQDQCGEAKRPTV
jgi:peptidoglycan/LPS O-acetylase OafA/YrhL